ncbi:phosphoesterase [Bordetella genomosp. 9]|uniref:Phosphoesterase n=1 Tax=Bordetella genomosp. 9 TaxID=1416803 RepID=A0A261REC0_9BORD|nr:ligase-associated DNA damage response endonuclease PdeM [Bordetella genomosp. 9]OZI23117.1 phosphoesterase [Bordetella genomosp. 9]
MNASPGQASPDDGHALTLAGEAVVLMGARALHWPARRRLIIADLHLGKGNVFRQAGIAVPSGATGDDLLRLTRLLARVDARELWIVGDVLHGPASHAAWRDAWARFRQAHAGVDIAAVIGNHDRALGGAELDIRQLGDAHADGPFLFRHLPDRDARGRHVIAGHVHPKARVPGVPRAWPAFWLREGVTVLPAFSEFTGGHALDAGQGQALVACVEGHALPLGLDAPRAPPAPAAGHAPC